MGAGHPLPPLHAVASGREEAPAIVFLHGFMGSAYDWDGIIARLQTCARCIAIDLPDHGGSRVAIEYDFDDVTRALDAVLERFSCEAPIVVGYSMGGRVALYWALHTSHRFARLVLESASPGLMEDAERTARRAVDAARAEAIQRDFPAFLRDWYAQPLFASLAGNPQRLERVIQERLQSNTPAVLARSLRCLGTGAQPPLWDALPRCACPVEVVAGAEDAKFTTLASRMTERFADARVHVAPQAGHAVHTEQTAWYAAMLAALLEHF
jgi:2-succinyl-6-hydroxy-2,4-cyclohexadiene-1-carboxylate synthase